MIKELIVLISAIVIVIAVGVPIMLNPPAETTPVLIHTQCFQDDPETPGACGNDVGLIAAGDWSVTDPTNSYDSDWATYSHTLCDGEGIEMAMYYDAPATMESAVWQVKWWEGSTLYQENYTIYENCDLMEDGTYQLNVIPYTDVNGDCDLMLTCYSEGGNHYFVGAPT